jgi:1-aminocyclopropane-1-carboxylate deaminase/D-cysteine desulfhydrase-like pyridoxal-dependent ACC family enzyme
MTLLRETLTTTDLRRAIDRLPRIELAHLPTPLEHLPRLSAALGGPPIHIKRDDCTGLAFGGNKTRHNEFLLAHARERGADMLVWCAGVQSNNCRQTAAACARLGLECRLILTRAAHADDVQGNLLLDHILGARVTIVDTPIGPELDELVAAETARLTAAGRRVYGWDRDVVKPRAAISYALCAAEIAEQCSVDGLDPAAVYACSAGSTGAGLALGRAALGTDWKLRLVAPIQWPWDHADDMAITANQAAELIDLPTRLEPVEIDSTLDHIGRGYGIPTPEGMEALALMARTEGILLDPVYTAKALAALIHDIRGGRLAPDRPVIFIHTGGTPALFAYRDELVAGLGGEGRWNAMPR